MNRNTMVNTVGEQYLTSNIEGGEFSYVQVAGSKNELISKIGHDIEHFKLDIRFEKEVEDLGKIAILIETKQNYVDGDVAQLNAYLEEERALFGNEEKVICILANTNNDKMRVWKTKIDDAHELIDEKFMESMDYYVSLFQYNRQNRREEVLINTYELNEMLHSKGINEKLRSQFVGTCILYIKNDLIKNYTDGGRIESSDLKKLKEIIDIKGSDGVRSSLNSTLEDLLNDSLNKAEKLVLLKNNVVNNQHVKELSKDDWSEILLFIIDKIYRYLDDSTSEGQDILNMFFVAFNKYAGKSDKNQAFTPDHITDFMCKITEVDRTKRVLDPCCGSGSFLVQAMVKEIAYCQKNLNCIEANTEIKKVKDNNIWGIESEEKAYGLATTNMLIHGDGNSNVYNGSCFELNDIIKKAKPDIILMNPPYNAIPKSIPNKYQNNWKLKKNAKEEPTKGTVFVKYLTEIAVEEKWKGTKLAVLLPMSAAIGSKAQVKEVKKYLLKYNTLDAVFSLSNEMFYPGASVQACCMVFTLNKPHYDMDGKPLKKTFFGYYKDDGFKKKKNIGRVEQFDANNDSLWKIIESDWIEWFRNKEIVKGKTCMKYVSGEDEWLCEAYMKTDYSSLTDKNFEQTIRNYYSYLIRAGGNNDEA